MNIIDKYLKEVFDKGGADLHLKVGRPPLMRLKGDLLPTDYPVISKKEIEELLMPLLTDAQKKKFENEKELDFSYLIEGVARFRGNIFYQLGNLGAVFRDRKSVV